MAMSPAVARFKADTAGLQSGFSTSWGKLAPEAGAYSTWEKTSRGRRVIAGQAVRMNLTVTADPEFQRFLSRLRRMPRHIQKESKRILRVAVREEVLRRLKPEIPKSDRVGRHLRSTAKTLSVRTNLAIVGVGSPRLWYAAIVHSGRSAASKKGFVRAVPFFPLAFRRAWKPLNDRLIRDYYDLMGWLATGRQRRRAF